MENEHNGGDVPCGGVHPETEKPNLVGYNLEIRQMKLDFHYKIILSLLIIDPGFLKVV